MATYLLKGRAVMYSERFERIFIMGSSYNDRFCVDIIIGAFILVMETNYFLLAFWHSIRLWTGCSQTHACNGHNLWFHLGQDLWRQRQTIREFWKIKKIIPLHFRRFALYRYKLETAGWLITISWPGVALWRYYISTLRWLKVPIDLGAIYPSQSVF